MPQQNPRLVEDRNQRQITECSINRFDEVLLQTPFSVHSSTVLSVRQINVTFSPSTSCPWLSFLSVQGYSVRSAR